MATLHQKRMYNGVFIGFGIRRSIAKVTTYRIRRGNGFYGAKLGEEYQDKYPYFVPTSITHAAGDASRATFANAITAWQALDEATKAVYNKRAHSIQFLSGYNLYIRRHMQDNY